MRVLILIFILLSGVFADEKVWIPYVERDAGKIDSAVLALDGKSFYTLKDGLITRWQLNPIKEMSSFSSDIKVARGTFSRVSMFVVENNSHMLLWTRNEFELWDLTSNTLLKKHFIKTAAILYINNMFITVDKDGTIVKRDANTLEIIVKSKIDILFESEPNEEINFIIGSDRYLFFGSKDFFIQLDTKTLKKVQELNIYAPAISSHEDYLYYKLKNCHVNEKCQFGYCKYMLSIKTGVIKHLVLNEYADENELHEFKKTASMIKRIYPAGYLSKFGKSSKTNNHILSLGSGRGKNAYSRTLGVRWFIYDRANNDKYNVFFLYENKEWIFMDEKKNFEISKNGRKYMKMAKKKSTNENELQINEISDEVFKKYNIKLEIKEK